MEETQLDESEINSIYRHYRDIHNDVGTNLLDRYSFCEKVDDVYDLSDTEWETLMEAKNKDLERLYDMKLEQNELVTLLEENYG